MAATDGILSSTTVLLVGRTDWVDPLATLLEGEHSASVRRAGTASDAVERVRTREVDCLVTEYHLDGDDGVGLTERIRRETGTVPVVVCTADGSEAVATDVLAAGATDYVACGQDTELGDVVARISRAVRTARRREAERDRARQFEAIFQNNDDATWVLDPAGRVQRANRAARELDGTDIGAIVGTPFWELSCWRGSGEGGRTDLRQFVTAAEASRTRRLTTDTGSDEPEVVDLSAHPVRSPSGELVAVVVTGSDVTERVSLHRELRESEQLHRVTLNNMTDTILVTNEAGEFTYVCPNVYFIFGYSVEEIRELGTIEALLGEELFDREELAARGTLKNIECTATDKAGDEHTLLVNVREVDIQDGTLLFSCRDVTKRKQREEALTTLHRTTRSLLYAETKREIAHRLVEDTGDILAVDASAVYLYRADEGRLRPVAYSPRMEKLHGPLGPLEATDESLLGRCFLRDETRVYDDVRGADRLENPGTGLRGSTVIPLGDHGVFVAGSSRAGVFDDITREIADLVAATAEAALDRVTRETRLRKQDSQLQRQNRRLTEVNEINDLIREIDRTLVGAETREEIHQSVCEALTRKHDFVFAWIGEFDPAGGVTPRAWAGTEQGYLEGWADLGEGEPAARVGRTGDPLVVPNVAEELREGAWQKHALTRGYQSVVSVPVAYDEFRYGVLTVYADAPDAFDALGRDVLAELGETVALALSALNRKKALLTSAGTRLEFETCDPEFLPVQLARRAGVGVELRNGLRNGDDRTVLLLTVDPPAAGAVREVASEMVSVEDVRLLAEGDQRSLLQLRLSHPFPAFSLADHGAILDRIVAEPERATVVVDVPAGIDSGLLGRHLTDQLDETELVAKRTGSRTAIHEFSSTVLDRLTDRQLEVVQTAYYSGYYESPRSRTGKELAETLGISPPAFYEHDRAVQRKLLSTLFEDVAPTSAQ